ncbi:MAG: SirB2 family protein [Gammaproteobacteria bacterium]
MLSLKLVHLAFATLSVALFALRGVWMLRESPLREARWTRVVPHVIDTVFLATGIWLALRIGQYPFVQPWLTAKVFGLVAYIILGSIALKRGPTRAIRATAFVAALAVFAWIVGVARARHPLSWWLWMA